MIIKPMAGQGDDINLAFTWTKEENSVCVCVCVCVCGGCLVELIQLSSSRSLALGHCINKKPI